MVEININPDTPSQAIIKSGNTAAVVTDERGRKITIKKLNALERMRLFELVGSENVENGPYFGYASFAYCVTDIDGEPVIHPGSKAQLEALVQRLDDDGINAIAKGVTENFMPKKDEDQKELVKNG